MWITLLYFCWRITDLKSFEDKISSKTIFCVFDTSFISIYLFIFERGKWKEKERERNIDVRGKHWSVASGLPPTGDLACNLGMCPDEELNWQPFVLQDDTQPTKPHQSGLGWFISLKKKKKKKESSPNSSSSVWHLLVFDKY